MANAILNPNLSKDSFDLTNLDLLCWRFSHCARGMMALVFLPCCSSMMNNERPTRLNDIRQLPCLQQAKYMSETYKKSLAQITPCIALWQTALWRLAKCRIEQDCPLPFWYAQDQSCVILKQRNKSNPNKQPPSPQGLLTVLPSLVILEKLLENREK